MLIVSKNKSEVNKVLGIEFIMKDIRDWQKKKKLGIKVTRDRHKVLFMSQCGYLRMGAKSKVDGKGSSNTFGRDISDFLRELFRRPKRVKREYGENDL